MKIDGNTLEEGVANFKLLRKYQPFKYSGKIHLAIINGQVYAMRYYKALFKRCENAGLTRFTIVTLY